MLTQTPHTLQKRHEELETGVEWQQFCLVAKVDQLPGLHRMSPSITILLPFFVYNRTATPTLMSSCLCLGPFLWLALLRSITPMSMAMFTTRGSATTAPTILTTVPMPTQTRNRKAAPTASAWMAAMSSWITWPAPVLRCLDFRPSYRWRCCASADHTNAKLCDIIFSFLPNKENGTFRREMQVIVEQVVKTCKIFVCQV